MMRGRRYGSITLLLPHRTPASLCPPQTTYGPDDYPILVAHINRLIDQLLQLTTIHKSWSETTILSWLH